MQSYSRRKLKEDRFQESAKEAVHWTVEHRNSLVVFGVALLAAALAAGGVLFYLNNRDDAAMTAMGDAMRTYTAPIRSADLPVDPTVTTYASVAERGKAAAKQFQDVAAKFPHTSAGKKASYLAGVALKDAGENAAAEKELKGVIDNGNADLQALSKLTLASLYASTNRDKEAADLYKDLVQHPTSTVPKQEAQFALAGYYQTKDPSEARRLYSELEKDTSPAVQQLAKIRLSEMGGK